LNIRELFEVEHQRLGDRIERAVRLTCAFEINVRDAISVTQAVVASEAVEDQGETLIAFHIAWAFEKFVEHTADQILR
jgi:hypothetical protein